MVHGRLLAATRVSAVALLAVAGASSSRADERLTVPANAIWKSECGACHLPYPPQLLPARSWQAIMGGLDNHFGADASLDPSARAQVTGFLERYAGRDRGVTPSNRITETAWFRRKHREVSTPVWKHANVRSPANCSACHPAADRGDFDEHGVRVPR